MIKYLIFTSVLFFFLPKSQGRTYNNGELIEIPESKLVNGKKYEIIKQYNKNRKFIGIYHKINDTIQGLCLQYHENGKIKQRKFFINQELEGEVTYYNEKGILIYLEYRKKSLPEGVSRSFYDDGKLKSINTMQNGQQNGQYISYYPNGRIRYIGKHKNGLEIGVWKEYYDNGNIKSIKNSYASSNFKINQKFRYFEYHENGKKAVKGFEFMGNQAGRWDIFDNKGKKNKIIYFDNKGNILRRKYLDPSIKNED